MQSALILLFQLLPILNVEGSSGNCFTNSNSFSSDSLKFLETRQKENEECDPILVTSIIDSLRNSTIDALFTDSIPDHLCQVVESLSLLYEKDVITRNCSWYTSSLHWKGSNGLISAKENLTSDRDEVENKERKLMRRSPFVRIFPSNLEHSLEFLHHFLTRSNISRFIIIVIYDANINSSSSQVKILSSILSSFANWDKRQSADGFLFLTTHLFHSQDGSRHVIPLLSSLSTQCKFCSVGVRLDPIVLNDTRELSVSALKYRFHHHQSESDTTSSVPLLE